MDDTELQPKLQPEGLTKTRLTTAGRGSWTINSVVRPTRRLAYGSTQVRWRRGRWERCRKHPRRGLVLLWRPSWSLLDVWAEVIGGRILTTCLGWGHSLPAVVLVRRPFPPSDW